MLSITTPLAIAETYLMLILLLLFIQAQSVVPHASCVPTKGGEPKLVVSVSLANQSEPIVQGYGVI